MDLSTLIAANVLILSVFAISFLAISFRVSPFGHWRSWALANALLASALVLFAFDRKLPLLAAYLVPNTLLLLGMGFHWHAARQLANLPSRISNVFAPASAYLLVASLSYVTSNYALAYTASNVIFTLLCVATVFAFTAPTFRGLISAIGLILAFFFIAAEGMMRTAHSLFYSGPAGPGMMNDMSADLHLMCALLFATLTGAFSLAVSFEQVAQRHREAARRDPLTGAFNRREFQRRLEELLQGTSADTFGLVHFDLDHFKSVNDRFGHLAGDQALVEVSKTVRRHLRSDDCFARLGGEEFAVILPSISRENAFKVADRLRKRIAELRFEFAPEGFQLTASSGIYHGNGDGLKTNELLQIVDNGLYQSKNTGRNRICVASPYATIDLPGS
ncbi:GGDEF domain-containing protein [Roseibium aggregatum]|uniref:diguanylate cyclase n=1 Tax=Roseibium aggregatum TaxID=187304 RepID=A0A939EE73_9HYPH|nr:GGDEF domain-containing protein [Roseibium aggregatum]MBN9671582.1 GGDEF domain-containing protein [Roseibium aggregatum]